MLRGAHSREIRDRLKVGIGLFILREVLFFAAWFWGFFHSRLNPVIELGAVWPPVGLFPLHPFQVPLLNTLLLLRSGVAVTWAHHRLLLNKGLNIPILWTLVCGGLFTFFQGFEYFNTFYSIADRIYGSRFFVSTGFHGLHVLVGRIFLLVIWGRAAQYQFDKIYHLGFECAIWYWHFVDVVWLFLFSFIYWWRW